MAESERVLSVDDEDLEALLDTQISFRHLLKIVEENIPACTKRGQNIYGRFNAGCCVLRILII
jgi:hypothetical protein